MNREVPWRAGNKTDSATRQQLLLLLVEKIAVPQLELVDPVLDIGEDSTLVVDSEPAPPPATVLDLRAVLFISADAQSVLPTHRWSLTVTTPAWQAAGTPPEKMELAFAPHHQPTGMLTFASPLSPPRADPTAGVQIHGAGLAVNNTGSVMLTARCRIGGRGHHLRTNRHPGSADAARHQG